MTQEAKSILPNSLAGSWYPASRNLLENEIREYLSNVSECDPGPVCALILPHAGYRYSGQTAAYGIKRIDGGDYSRVVVMGPSHRIPFRNTVSVPKATHYETPLGLAPLDVEFLSRLAESDAVTHHPSVHEVEHSVQIEVPFLQTVLGDTPLVPIVVGQFEEAATEAMADSLLNLIDDRTLLVASSDFTHYGASFGYLPFGTDIEENIRILDFGAYSKIEEKDFRGFREYCRETGATICGRDAIGILLAMLGPDAEANRLWYETSGNLTGEWDHSVSYLSVAFTGRFRHGK